MDQGVNETRWKMLTITSATMTEGLEKKNYDKNIAKRVRSFLIACVI
jgi:hypothetical protein